MIDLTNDKSRQLKHAIVTAIMDGFRSFGKDYTMSNAEIGETYVYFAVSDKDLYTNDVFMDVDLSMSTDEAYRASRFKIERALKALGSDFMTHEELAIERMKITDQPKKV